MCHGIVRKQIFWDLPFRGKMHHVGGMKRERDDDDEVSWILAHLIKTTTHISIHPSRAIQVRKNLEDFNLMAMVQERARRPRAEWRSRWSSLTTSWEGFELSKLFSLLNYSLFPFLICTFVLTIKLVWPQVHNIFEAENRNNEESIWTLNPDWYTSEEALITECLHVDEYL